MAQETAKSNSYGTLGIVTSLSLHVLILGVLAISCIMDKEPEPIPPINVELFDVEPIMVQPAPSVPEPEQPKQEEQTPEPEPPKPKEPEPPKPKEPEPPKPKEPEPPKPKEPEPQKIERPKKPSIEDRLKNAKVTQPQPQKPQKPNTAAKDISKRLENMQKTSASTISRTSANPNGLPAAQLSAYQNYLAGCLEPEMQRAWDVCGPDRLPNPPKPVMVSLIVSPAGRVTSGFIKEPSDSDQMNRCAKALLERMKSVNLQPFSRVGLPMNASLTFNVYLNYKTGTAK